ncbi:DUF2306 domain-containing protein [Sphingomonas sp. MAH-20]|uniref:DUF2306 domain-containing protein n=1 Tax=Sphingomonas horti TaxID=2682842 RepID=A0A6I4IX25_9SPHN|nr:MULTISPECIES: DUF2306 domain-containing protein [Sphingomonas]MBA2920372.1 DUF2306 domain-containing protein [Sphingomonas sp. CGMCC 1.13658]MVO76626.1 DUF2306 domain-containing protein [Sphingomonas horti]
MQSRSITLPGTVFSFAILSTLFVLWTTVLPMVDGRGWPRHIEHLPILLTHIAGGVLMITLGACALFLGWNRRALGWHRWVGRAYLLSGSIAALLVIVMAATVPHEPQSLYVATGTLALVWLAVAAMGWRAARNRRFASHREWMIRSYVLSWTFVGCRLATTVDFYPWLGIEGVTAAIWVNWIVPLVACEIALRWKEGAPVARPDRALSPDGLQARRLSRSTCL